MTWVEQGVLFMAMSTYLTAAFFLLFGVMNVAKTEIPSWVLGATALAVAAVLVKAGLESKR